MWIHNNIWLCPLDKFPIFILWYDCLLRCNCVSGTNGIVWAETLLDCKSSEKSKLYFSRNMKNNIKVSKTHKNAKSHKIIKIGNQGAGGMRLWKMSHGGDVVVDEEKFRAKDWWLRAHNIQKSSSVWLWVLEAIEKSRIVPTINDDGGCLNSSHREEAELGDDDIGGGATRWWWPFGSEWQFGSSRSGLTSFRKKFTVVTFHYQLMSLELIEWFAELWVINEWFLNKLSNWQN